MTKLPLAKLLLVAALLLGAAPAAVGSAFAVQPDEMLANKALEARARDIGEGMRCLVCQNESIEESNAELARDLRLLIRKKLVEGDTNQQVISYIVSRYGDYVLLKPPFKAATLVLWLGPPVMLVLGAVGVFFFYRRRRDRLANEAPPPLSREEKRRLNALLKDGAP